jgi:uncharacterized protein YcbX
MARVGTIKEIWQFPVKSMRGDTISRCMITERGLVGDRCWAMRDEARKEVTWGKRCPELMLCSARYRVDPTPDDIMPVDITFPDGKTIGSDDESVHAKLSEVVGTDARLWPLQPADDVEFYKRYKPDAKKFQQEAADWFAREPGEPVPDLASFPEVLIDHVAVPGTFFDNEEIHLITTASIAYMASLNAEADWNIRRFPPNFHIETDAGLDGLVENDWLGKKLRIGDATLEITEPTVRCGMTVRPQKGLAFDKTILRTVCKEGNQCLGVGAHVREPGEVCQGDIVEIID